MNLLKFKNNKKSYFLLKKSIYAQLDLFAFFTMTLVYLSFLLY